MLRFVLFALLTMPGVAAVAAPPPPPLRQKPPAPVAATTTAATTPTPRPSAVVTRPVSLSDAGIEKEIRARFQKSKIRSEGFTVTVAGGVATIQGRTSVIQRKGTATRLARLGGARSVVNRIEVDEAALERAKGNLEKGRRKRAELTSRSEPRSSQARQK